MKISDSLRKTLLYRGFAFVGRLALFVLGVFGFGNALLGGFAGLVVGELYATFLYFLFERFWLRKDYYRKKVVTFVR